MFISVFIVCAILITPMTTMGSSLNNNNTTSKLWFRRDAEEGQLRYERTFPPNFDDIRLSNAEKRPESLHGGPDKTAEVYEPAACPTSICTCTRDTDKIPPLYQINCRHKGLNTIPKFNSTGVIYDELNFADGNSISEIPYAAFYKLKVRKIDLQNNDINYISGGAFIGLDGVLEVLYLQGSGSNNIPYDKLSNLRSLTDLQFHNFGDDTIPNIDSLRSFEKLKILEFQTMKNLFTIDINAFTNKLPFLETLIFEEVSFTEIPVGPLNQVKSLRKLKISRSNIKRIHAESFAGENLQNLNELEISNSDISEIDERAFDKVCSNLMTLDLRLNKITDVAALKMQIWPKLVDLNLSYNTRLGSLSTNTFQNMPVLEYLNLMNVNLQSILLTTFNGLHQLNTLELSYNKIEYIQEGSFRSTPNLIDLRLGYQSTGRLSELDLAPSVLNGITTSLRRLAVDGTRLRADSFWKSIELLTELEYLYASENTGLYSIPDIAFKNSLKLKTLELEKNNIQTIRHSAFVGLEESLQKISLRSNNLTSISKCVFKNFMNLQRIQLAENNLHCDCQLKWLHEFVTKKRSEGHYIFIECRTPKRFSGTYLNDIPLDELVCPASVEPTCETTTHPSTQISTAMTTSDSTAVPPTTTVSSITVTHTSTATPASLALYIGASTQTSMSLYWSTKGIKVPILGFKIDYYALVDHVKMTVSVAPEAKEFTIKGLKPRLEYKICISVETTIGSHITVKDCKTRNTLGEESQSQGYKDESNHNTVIVILVTSVIVVVLIIAGMYMLVKYKIQKLRELRLTLTSPGLPRRDEDSTSCTVPNDYVEIRNAKQLKEAYAVYSTKQLQRQLEKDNPYKDRYYSTYRKDKKHKNRNREFVDSDNKDADDKVVYTEVSEQMKSELETRHSAPSRINANDLVRGGRDRANSRPLPATPIENANQSKDGKEEMNAKTRNVFMTQASVYAPRSPDAQSIYEKREEIYHELSETDTTCISEQ